MSLANWVIWADAAANGNAPAQEGAGSALTFLPLLLIMLLFFFLFLRPQQRERAQRDTMLAGLKKNDRVVTAGGIYGIVTNVQKESDEVTLRIDEATNTKIRVTFGSIARVLGDESAPGDAK